MTSRQVSFLKTYDTWYLFKGQTSTGTFFDYLLEHNNYADTIPELLLERVDIGKNERRTDSQGSGLSTSSAKSLGYRKDSRYTRSTRLREKTLFHNFVSATCTSGKRMKLTFVFTTRAVYLMQHAVLMTRIRYEIKSANILTEFLNSETYRLDSFSEHDVWAR